MDNDQPEEDSGMMMYVAGAVVLLILAGLYWYFYAGGKDTLGPILPGTGTTPPTTSGGTPQPTPGPGPSPPPATSGGTPLPPNPTTPPASSTPAPTPSGVDPNYGKNIADEGGDLPFVLADWGKLTTAQKIGMGLPAYMLDANYSVAYDPTLKYYGRGGTMVANNCAYLCQIDPKCGSSIFLGQMGSTCYGKLK